ncbi:MAG TPA: RidA family protein [Bryobacteraceae bacterium]|nr:RidA family protein [Bryobacteraceae bacterium]
MKEIICTEAAPKAIGPYSQAVRVGNFVFLSGQIPNDPATGQVLEGTIEKQTERVLENMKAVLRAAGLTFENVVKTTVFLRNLNDFTYMNEVYARYFSKNPPARSTIQAARLPREVDIEIDAIAVVS